MLKVVVETYEDIAEFLKDEKETFTVAIIDAIERGWKEKLSSVVVAEFTITNDEDAQELSIAIEEDDWSESLYLALYHYEEIEDYDTEPMEAVKALRLITKGQVAIEVACNDPDDERTHNYEGQIEKLAYIG